MSPSPRPVNPSADATAVVRALDAVSTQLGRIADALPTPVVEYAVTADDDATTPGDARQQAYEPVYAYLRKLGDEMPTSRIGRNEMIWTAVNAALDARPAPMDPVYILGIDKGDGCLAHIEGACDGTTRDCAFITDEGRATVLRTLVDRAARGVLNDQEATALRQRAEQVIRGRDVWKVRASQAEDLLRVANETSNRSEAARAEAQAAIERVRALHSPRDNGTCAARCYSTGMAPEPSPCPTIRALDGTEQPTTEA